MSSVTKRARDVTQPRGGYLKPKVLSIVEFDDGITLNPIESVHASLVGMATDYLTRFMMGAPTDSAFRISLMGSLRANMYENAKLLVSAINGLDDISIINACKITGYDVWYRANGVGYKPVEDILPDANTIENVRTMVNRCVTFWNKYGPIVASGLNFEGGYTVLVDSGDCDYLTSDTLWDLKVSKNPPKNVDTLQLLMYYIMGRHSAHTEFGSVKKLGIFNPRLNNAYLLDVSNISSEIIQKVSSDVIGYK